MASDDATPLRRLIRSTPIYPSAAEYVRAYLRSGCLPPLSCLLRNAGPVFAIMVALCFGAGLLIGGSL
jgi:hypothetical protein